MTKRPLTKAEIQALSDDDLVAKIDEGTRRGIHAIVRAGLGDPKPKKRSDESGAEYTRRCREAKEVYDEELGRALRTAFEKQVWDGQRLARFMATMAPTPAEQAETEKRELAFQERQAQMDDSGLRPVG